MTSNFKAALQGAHTSAGETLSALSQRSPLLIVFLRHAGCTFCREAIADLAQRQTEIQKLGVAIVLVHQGEDASMSALCEKYGLRSATLIADPDHFLYHAFELRRGGLRQLLSPYVFWRGMVTALFRGYGFAIPKTDALQMPGAFLVHHDQIVKAYRHVTAADRPDYESLACPIQ